MRSACLLPGLKADERALRQAQNGRGGQALGSGRRDRPRQGSDADRAPPGLRARCWQVPCLLSPQLLAYRRGSCCAPRGTEPEGRGQGEESMLLPPPMEHQPQHEGSTLIT